MGKFLLFLLIVFAAVMLFKAQKRRHRAGGAPPPVRKPVERMVVCGHCGVHLPESDSVASGGKHFCSDEHRRLAE